MRRHEKASTAGSTQRQATGLGRFFRGALATRGVSGDADGSGAPSGAHLRRRVAGRTSLAAAALAVLSLAVLVFSAALASAATVTSHPLRPFSPITGSGIGVTFHYPSGIAVDETSGNVFLADGDFPGGADGNVTDIFDAEGGVPSGVSSPYQITGFGFGPNFSGAAVDNSATSPSKGALYVADASAHAVKKFVRNPGTELYEPAGQLIPTGFSPAPFGVAVDSHGNVFVGNYNGGTVVEFSPTGTQLAQIDVSGTVVNTGAVALDNAGDLFVQGINNGSVYKYPANGSGEIEETVFTQVVPSGANGVAVDAGTNTLYVPFGDHVVQYDAATLTPQGEFGDGALSTASRLAVNSTTGNIYVSDEAQATVVVFGPAVTGTVPDSTIEASTEVGINKVRFNGKVNPQGVPNSYVFQWKQGTEASWAGASSSAPQSLPVDSADHAVSFDATGLTGDTTYQVRLVATNTSNNLFLPSAGADTFTTAAPVSAPITTMEPASSVGTTTATLNAKVNPREDTQTTYQFATSTDPACASGFTTRSSHKLESEASTPVAVAEGLSGLLPHQHYCARISATNSAGTQTSTSIEFTTDTAVPDQVFTAFAAPRTDTTARINGRVNPEGVPLTYRFEYSKDGGATWISLGDHEYTGNARKQIILAADLTGLTPNTPYSYRVSVENEAGAALQQGAVLEFTTRTTVEMTPPARGLELVNNPDKGNQRVLPQGIIWWGTSPMSFDGEKVVWAVSGGIPSGTSGTGATFLAKRTPSGWKSTSLIPQANDQVGGGGFRYTLEAINSDFSRFVFAASLSKATSAFMDTPIALWLDESQQEEVLSSTEAVNFDPRGTFEISDDANHVLFSDPDTQQIEDVAGGNSEVVSIMPEGLPAECPGGTFGESLRDAQWQEGYRVSTAEDASRLYFQAKPNADCSSLYGLYERNRDSATTTLIDPGAFGHDPELIRATPDGRSAYFASFSQLDPADGNEHRDLYRWDEQSGESHCLTCEAVADANIRDQVLVSNDFSHFYFESTAELVPGQGTQGDRNIYVLSDGSVRFVADPPGGFFSVLDEEDHLSADGNALLFKTPAGSGLTADEMANQCFEVREGIDTPSACIELYRYDDRDRSLECISCNHDGVTTYALGAERNLTNPIYGLSADGSTVPFLTSESLVTLDVNRDPDAYEWRNGAVHLLTDGISEQSVFISAPGVIAVDRDGSNILLALSPPSGKKLTGFEQDGLLNYYDARIGGGFEPPPPPVHCSEDSCQGPLQPAPAAGPPASTTYAGAGNEKPQAKKRRLCAGKRGKARQRCIRKHRRQAPGSRAHHNGGGAK